MRPIATMPAEAPNNARQGADGGHALRLLVAGGGTGGHIFPGIAVAREFTARNPGNRVLFVSTGNAMECRLLSAAGFELQTVSAEGIKGRGVFRQARAAFKLPGGIAAAVRIVRAFRPDVVLGVGSYSAGPVVVGARLMRVKIALHEQNILPGITNRLLARFADRIFVSFDSTRARFDRQRVEVSGNPVRKEIAALAQEPKDAAADTAGKRLQVLILGGSQGAHRINQAVLEALALLRDKVRCHFVHQAGIQDEAAVRQAYRQAGIAAQVAPFFDDMAQQYRNADLIVCRAGATTVAEISAAAKAVIFIPFPYAADNHQELNARALADIGAAEIILERELNGQRLAERIAYYDADRAALALIAQKAGALGRPDAARIIVDGCCRLAEGR